MRTLTAAQTNLLEKNNRGHHVRVSVDRGSGWEALDDLEGYNWIQGFTRDQSLDNNIVSAEIVLYKKIFELNLSLLVDGSKLNAAGTLLDIGNAVKIETATMPENSDASDSDFVEVFVGEIEQVKWAGSFIVLSCLDNMERLNSTFIETQRVYGETAGEDIEYALQDIMDDNNPEKGSISINYTWDGTTTVTMADTSEIAVGDYIALSAAAFFKISAITPNTDATITNPDSRTIPTGSGAGSSLLIAAADRWILYTPNGTTATPLNSGDLTGWLVKQWKQSKESLLGVLSGLIQETGYDIRYTYHDNTSAFQYIIDRPPRGVCSRGTFTFTGQPSAAQLFLLDAAVHTIVANGTTPGTDEVELGTTLNETLKNIARDVNALSSERENIYCYKEGDTKVVFEIKAPGTAGNNIDFGEALSNCLADGAGKFGGTRAGAQATTTSDWTFDDTNYEKFSNISLDRSNIRNVCRVSFSNVDDDFRETNLTKENAASIAKYGRRYLEITEGSTSQIDTGAEASDFCTAALEDLREPEADLSAPVPYFWPVQLWDNITFTADDDHFDTDQTLSVIGIKDSFSDKKNTTSLILRGQPSGGVMRWLRLEGRAGNAPGLDLYTDLEAQNATIVPGLGTIIINYDDPRTMDPPMTDWATSRVYISTSPGVDKLNGTLAGIGKQTRFEINGLTPGTTYYAVIYVVAHQGNEKLISSEISTATYKNAPYFENADREHGVLLPNQDFGISTIGNTEPPDFWEMSTGTWGSGSDVYINTSFVKSNGRSLHFLDSSTADVHVTSDFFPLQEEFFYRFGATYYIDEYHVGAVGINRGILSLRYYDKDKSYINDDDIDLQVTAPAGARPEDTWYTDTSSQSQGALGYTTEGYMPPSGATYGKLRIRKVTDSGPEAFNMYIDSVFVAKHPAMFKASMHVISPSQVINPGAWTTLQLNDDLFDSPDTSYTAAAYTYTIPVAGVYNIMVRVAWSLATLGAGDIVTARIVGSDTVTSSPITYANNGETYLYNLVETGARFFEAGAVFSVEVKLTSGSNATVVGTAGGLYPTLFSGSQISI